MKNKVDVIICTNKRLLGLKKLIYQILNQKGFFEFRIILIHQSKFKPILPNFLNSKKIIYKNLKKQNLSLAKNHYLYSQKYLDLIFYYFQKDLFDC